MPFIGKQPDSGGYQILDAMTASATASYTMQINSTNFEPGSANQLIVSLNGVIRKPGSSFTISGSTLTFSSALTSSDSIDFVLVLGDTLDIGTPSAGSTVPGNFGVAGVQTINRTGNGDLIALQKGGVDSGSISIESSGTAFDGEGSHAGLKMFASAVASRQNGADVDNLIDLGWSGGRWRNLYLGGGLAVGGTGTANTLDDYEEGDWTPAVQSGGWGLSTSMARYTKIGRQVTVMTDTSLTGSGDSNDLIISGLPFTNSTNGYASGAGYMATYPTSPNNHFTPMVNSNATNVYFMNGNGAYYNGNQFSAGYFNFNVTYFV